MDYLTDEDYKIAESNGISYKNAYNRFYNCHWSKEDTITKPIKTSLWDEYKDLCAANGVSQMTFYSRVKRKMEPEKAATKPITPKTEHVHIRPNAKITKEVRAEAEKRGIKYTTLRKRVYGLHWSVEKALNEPVDTEGKKSRSWNQRSGIR